MYDKTKRISLMIREDQHEKIHDMGLNLSGFIRDLIDDYLSDTKITLSVSQETWEIYNQIVSNTGSSDAELETYVKRAFKEALKAKIDAMQKLHSTL